jgi:autotransporter strand-loop-strand O-heptosyltransferase
MKIVKAHTSFIGTTGYNSHAQNFFSELNKLTPTRVRNFTIGKSWRGHSNTPHNNEPYITKEMKEMLVEQTLINNDGSRVDLPIYNYNKNDDNDINIVLNETNHHYFYDTHLYNGYKIAYNVWETTLYPQHFFDKLLEYDELWMPTKWQRDCVIAQGYPKEKVFIVPEGVDIETFKPVQKIHKNKFTFVYFGRWDYRKATMEVVRAFSQEFANDDDVELILSADNPYAVDGFNSTEERLEHYNIDTKNIRVVHFPSREEYVTYLQQGDVFLSCARSEGWNLPLIEAMSCGMPSIYSNWGGQLEFANNKGLPVKILGERFASDGDGLQYNNNANGNYCEPDFEDLRLQMRLVKSFYSTYKKQALEEAKDIHENFNWQKVTKIGANRIKQIRSKLYPRDYFNDNKDEIVIIPCYCDTLERTQMLKDCIASIKKYNKKILLTSHYPISDELQNLVDYAIYDGDNHVLYSKDYQDYNVSFKFWYNYDSFLITQSYPYIHSYAVWTLMRNGFTYANILGYKNAHVVDYDCTIGDSKYFEDVNKLFESYDGVFYKFCDEVKDGEANYLSILFSLNVNNGEYIFNKYKNLKEYCNNPYHNIVMEVLMANELKSIGVNHIVLENKNAKSYGNVLDKFSVMESIVEYQYDENDLQLGFFSLNENDNILVIINKEGFEKSLNLNINDRSKQIKLDAFGDALISFNKSDSYVVKINNYIVLKCNLDNNYYSHNQIELKQNAMVEKLHEHSTYDFEYVDREINQEKIYEKYFDFEQGDVVVDVGGHAGFFSERASKMGASKIITIEPDSDCCEIIKEKLDASGLEYKVYNCAIADTNDLLYFDGSGLAGHIVNYETSRSVQGITFEKLIQDNNLTKIDFLKLDCEGGEYSIINEKNIELFKRVCKKVACEIHLQHPYQKYQCIDLFNLLDKHNIDYAITSVNGVVLSKEKVLERIDFYTEVLLYISMNRMTTEFNLSFFDGAKVEINSRFDNKYLVQFIDDDTKELVFSDLIKNNMWTKTSILYYKKWLVRIYDLKKSMLVLEQTLDLKDRNVLVYLESKALGDTLAWFPYIDEFQKKHNCKLYCSTFNNDLIDTKTYPNLNFIEMGEHLDDVFAVYRIGWFYDENNNIRLNMNPREVKNLPMQQTATDILGLEYKEVKTRIKLHDNVEKKKQVAIAIHGTCQAKYWNNPSGWQEVVDYCKSMGYEVLLLSQEEDGYMGNRHPIGIVQQPKGSLSDIIRCIQESVVFIGIGSGLSWLSWCTQTPTVLISGFSEAYTEPNVYSRIVAPKDLCNGCFNKERLDPSDWNWCPQNKDFECSKLISSAEVINSIKNLVI